MPTANARAKTNKSAAARNSGHGDAYRWLSRFFAAVCFALVTTVTVLSLSLLHLTGEADVDSVLVTAPTYSENLAYFEPLHADMPTMDVLSEMFVRQFIVMTNTLYKNQRMMLLMWGSRGIVDYMSSPAIYKEFWDRVSKTQFDGEHTADVTIEPHIRQILKEGWNSFQIFFDTRIMRSNLEEPLIRHWIATIQFRYYSYNAVMFTRLMNPMGFTVTQYHLAQQKK